MPYLVVVLEGKFEANFSFLKVFLTLFSLSLQQSNDTLGFLEH